MCVQIKVRNECRINVFTFVHARARAFAVQQFNGKKKTSCVSGTRTSILRAVEAKQYSRRCPWFLSKNNSGVCVMKWQCHGGSCSVKKSNCHPRPALQKQTRGKAKEALTQRCLCWIFNYSLQTTVRPQQRDTCKLKQRFVATPSGCQPCVYLHIERYTYTLACVLLLSFVYRKQYKRIFARVLALLSPTSNLQTVCVHGNCIEICPAPCCMQTYTIL